MDNNQKPQNKSIKIGRLYRKEYNGKSFWTLKSGSVQYVMYENSFKEKADDADFVLYLKEAPKTQGAYQQKQQWQQRPNPGPIASQQHPYAPQRKTQQNPVTAPDTLANKPQLAPEEPLWSPDEPWGEDENGGWTGV